MKITRAEFITSAAGRDQFLAAEKPIIAVCGRSNVGKSSFINMLANNKKLARVSQQPGRTRLVNYFDFGSFILADLPGYGYARVSKQEKARWAKMLDDFFAAKQNISHVFTLCDIRHDPTADDKSMVEYLYYNLIPFTVVATKSDKLSRAQVDRSVTNIAATYKCGRGNILAVSSLTRQGLNEVLAVIEGVLSRVKNAQNGSEDEEEDI